nr:Protein F38A5.6 [Haemonchus contortus]
MNKIYLKAAGKIGIVEETKLEPAFEQGIKKVETYRLAVDCVLDGLEAIMQPNHKIVETGAIVAPPGQNPHELMATACTKMKRFLGNNEQARIEIVINSMNKMGEAERSSQTKGRAAIRRLRRFVTVDNQQMKEDMDKMKEWLVTMDAARHEVKNTKTKEELEEKGMFYHKSVKAFNDQIAPKVRAQSIFLIYGFNAS